MCRYGRLWEGQLLAAASVARLWLPTVELWDH